MTDELVTLQVPEKDLAVFVACLAIGTLRQIQRDHLRPQLGIWTLAPPRFVEPLEKRAMPAELIAVLRACDELSGIQKTDTPEFLRYIDELVDRLEGVIRSIQDPTFKVFWA